MICGAISYCAGGGGLKEWPRRWPGVRLPCMTNKARKSTGEPRAIGYPPPPPARTSTHMYAHTSKRSTGYAHAESCCHGMTTYTYVHLYACVHWACVQADIPAAQERSSQHTTTKTATLPFFSVQAMFFGYASRHWFGQVYISVGVGCGWVVLDVAAPSRDTWQECLGCVVRTCVCVCG